MYNVFSIQTSISILMKGCCFNLNKTIIYFTSVLYLCLLNEIKLSLYISFFVDFFFQLMVILVVFSLKYNVSIIYKGIGNHVYLSSMFILCICLLTQVLSLGLTKNRRSYSFNHITDIVFFGLQWLRFRISLVINALDKLVLLFDI